MTRKGKKRKLGQQKQANKRPEWFNMRGFFSKTSFNLPKIKSRIYKKRRWKLLFFFNLAISTRYLNNFCLNNLSYLYLY